MPADRYEKRHKNLAAHVSPAFRVELGDVVTVGQSRTADGCPDFDHESEMMNDVHRSMSTAIENGAIQRTAGGKEQGGDEDIRQVLSVGDGLLCRIQDVYCALDHDVYSMPCKANDDTSVRNQIRAK